MKIYVKLSSFKFITSKNNVISINLGINITKYQTIAIRIDTICKPKLLNLVFVSHKKVNSNKITNRLTDIVNVLIKLYGVENLL
jgi:hypothetical protein